jgi:Cu-processing system permease protein
VLYDGLVLFVVAAFSDYPLETPMLVLTLLNPVDLARVLLLLTFDVAALMGYTGAVFERFFGSGLGVLAALAALLGWTALPFVAGLRGFSRKDF